MNPGGPDPRSTYWRSLEELRHTPQFEEFLHREFPQAASEFPEGVSRRRWMQLMGASLALVGASGCRWEAEEFLPSVSRIPDYIPGVPQHFATFQELRGFARSLVVRKFDGRPIKVEGNPEHPQSHGAADAFAQACILDLYDPDRIGSPRELVDGKPAERNWTQVEEAIRAVAGGDASKVRVLAGASSSPSRARLEQALLEKLSGAKWVEFESVSRQNVERGAQQAFGERVRPVYRFDQARVMLAIDGDPFGADPDQVNMARGWASQRDPDAGTMNRLYVVESQFSATGVAADHREPIAASRIPAFLDELEAAIGEAGSGEPSTKNLFIKALASDLVENRGAGVIYVGPRQPASVHARVHRLNAQLENIGNTVVFQAIEGPERAPYAQALAELVKEMESGAVETLVILRGNPVFDAPGDVAFGEALGKVANTIHLSEYQNETSRACRWYLPATHAFEQWGDGRSVDGTLTLQQPLIDPLHGGKSELELLAMLLGEGPKNGEQIVRETIGTDGMAWKQALHDGFVKDSAAEFVEVSATDAGGNGEEQPVTPVEPGGDSYEVVFCESEQVFDGRFANNGWLQETPQFLSKLTWDNAAILSYEDAEALGVGFEDVITLTIGENSVRLPVYVLPGQARGSIGVALGYGRTAAGLVGGFVDAAGKVVAPSVGVAVNGLRSVAAMDFVTGVKVASAGTTYPLATTQDHFAIDTIGLQEISDRVPKLVREATPKLLAEHPGMIEHAVHHPPLESLWDSPDYAIDHAWGMSIDLSKCIGCNACLVACQSENNVPIVGKDQVRRGREMHWLRIDRYFRGNPRLKPGDVKVPEQAGSEPRGVVVTGQPVLCMHCEHAPCESVCPVAAAVHDREGLNLMVYNRCVGTRYCNNNCPYKVRRFNFFNWDKREPANRKYLGLNVLSETGVAQDKEKVKALAAMAQNPEVTVRSRGVMEKCTYCQQRISAGKIEARNASVRDGNPNVKVPDGTIQTACQQTCPTGAIVFGDLSDKNSRVSQVHHMGEKPHPRAYAMLAELNIRPRTAYMARVRNPHPLLEDLEPYSIPPIGHAHEHHGEEGHGADHDHDHDHDHDQEAAGERRGQ